MANVIFCADGTWNGPGEPDPGPASSSPTNVFRLFQMLQGQDTPGTQPLAKEQERVLTGQGGFMQWAKYLHGVGDSDNILVRLLGGVLGAGVIARIVRGYTFISRTFRPGDRIFIVGFSRGAYTARALAGMIASQGLMDSSALSKEEAYRAGSAVWLQWRRTIHATNWVERAAEIIVELPGLFQEPLAAPRMVPVDMAAVAVWDTVGALGIPAYTMKAGRLDAFQFANRTLSDKVGRGFQAVAVDEQRQDFTPTFWDPSPGRITQALFPGAHGDVGGGEPGAGGNALSDCALVWMRDRLATLGMLFGPVPSSVAPDPCGVAHQPWTALPWRLLPQGPRSIPPGLELSDSIHARVACAGGVAAAPGATPSSYRPVNLAAYGIAPPPAS